METRGWGAGKLRVGHLLSRFEALVCILKGQVQHKTDVVHVIVSFANDKSRRQSYGHAHKELLDLKDPPNCRRYPMSEILT